MRFMYEDVFDPASGRAGQLRRWLAAHGAELRAACPAGVSYLGAFATVHTSSDERSDIRVCWGSDSYRAIEAFEVAMAEAGPLRDLLRELHEVAGGSRFGRRSGLTLLTAIDEPAPATPADPARHLRSLQAS